MKRVAIVGAGKNNDIFNPESLGNRDNCYLPFIELRQQLMCHGYEIHTQDQLFDNSIAFEIHMNARHKIRNIPAYLLLMETPLICPANGDLALLGSYRKVFTWNDNLVNDEKYVHLHLPNPMIVPAVDGFSNRPDFCCLIAGNKTVSEPDARELYSERVNVIRWFEKNAADDFFLYGIGWDKPPPHPGKKLKNRLIKKLWGIISILSVNKPFPAYCGTVLHKGLVLKKTRFCICYENVKNMPGYITEKIFDCFFSGCVPVYWGANNITDYIPENCFIDRRKFKDTAEVYDFLKTITESEFKNYQRAIIDFLNSDKARLFSSDFFAETITNTILQDLATKHG